MKSSQYHNLVKSKGYQVFLLSCPAALPLNFARHPWFVCIKDGEVTRWEVRLSRNQKNAEQGRHLHLNSLPPFCGTEMIPFLFNKFFWSSKLIGYIEGDDNSKAKKVYDFIALSPQSYEFQNRYLPWGPNSNTYAEWVLNNFSLTEMCLPWNCFGKKYKKR
jgi:hypothetical protein